MLNKRSRFLFTSSLVFLLTACSALAAPGAAPGPQEFSCDRGGMIHDLSLEQTGRGYPYSYSLYLPPCYEDHPERRYPVIYLIPGRGSSPYTWFNAGAGAAADEVILNRETPPFIMAATENINADMYADTILNDLVPHIESSYRVSPERGRRAVAGGSLGGIAAYRIVFRFPDRFASAALFGSGVVAGEEGAIRAWLEAIPAKDRPRAFFNCGESDTYMLEQAQVMMALLDEAGISHTEIFSEGGHNYNYWVANLPAYFRWAAEDWQ